VNSTTDVSDGDTSSIAALMATPGPDGVISLREAITAANNTAGADTINFNIPGAGVRTITPTSALPTITGPVTIEGYTQPGASANTLAAGDDSVHLIELSGGPVGAALIITAGNSTICGLVINHFTNVAFNAGDGIRLLTNGGNKVEGCFIGISADGATAQSNTGSGIDIESSPNNTIGGATPAARNVISSNTSSTNIVINGAGSSGNTIQGNYIGTNAAGTAAMAGSVIGVQIVGNLAGTGSNIIGGTTAAARNVISGNSSIGIDLHENTVNGNVIQGNFIGTNAAGTAAIGNGDGIDLVRANNNTFGGTVAEAGNVISGNSGHGISLADSSSNLIQGNLVGTDAAGTAAVPNVAGVGILIGGGSNNTIGGTTPGARNIISGNGTGGNGHGIRFALDATTDSGNLVQGNYIGTDINGTAALGNAGAGIQIFAFVQPTGVNTIGGTSAAARNIISANGGSGITGGVNNFLIQGNYIGTDVNGTADLGNGNNGIELDTATNTTIGGAAAGAGNVIAFNGKNTNATNGDGIHIFGNTGNSIGGNSIFSNKRLGIDLVGGTENTFGVTANDSCDPDTGANNLQNFPVITSATTTGTNVMLAGTLNSTANTTFRIEIFSNSSCDPSGNGEGESYLGFTMVTTDAMCNASINITFAASIPAGRVLTLTATDPSGNTSEFSQCITVVAECTITCPDNITTGTGPGAMSCCAVVNYPAPTTTGSCGTVTCGPISGSCFPVGTNTVTCNSNNGAGPEMCTFTVTVTDNTPPTIGACPANITKSTDPNVCTAIVTFTPPTATDNCTPAPTVACSPQSGSTFNKGTTTVTCTATDSSNNTAMCSFTVTVNDTQNPSVTCPNDKTFTTTGNNDPCGVVTYTTPTGSDNCAVQSVVCNPPSGTCFPVGMTTVTCTATDTSNNTGQCTFKVTVQNPVQNPCTITCPPNQTANTGPGATQCCAVVNYPAPTTTGSCGTVMCSPASGSCFPVGATTVTCKSNNGAGPEMCTFIVTVTDNTPPTITCSPGITGVAAASCPIATGTPASFTVTPTDNCAVQSVVCNPPSGSTFPVGATTVTCTATDTSGNTATCTFPVNAFSFCLQDETNPGNFVLINAATGDYSFFCNGVLIASGRGTLNAKACIGSIEHNKGDRRVYMEWDTTAAGGKGAGTAIVQLGVNNTRCQITDKNMSNNTCSAPPPVTSPRDRNEQP
jgi:hypothetical protein